MTSDLRNYLSLLGDKLLRISDPVDPVRQAPYLISESRGPLLFDNLTGFPDWQLTDRLVATRDTQALVLGTEPANVVRRLAELIYDTPLRPARLVDTGPCQEVLLEGDNIDIRTLPIPVHSVGDAGQYLGSGLTTTKDPDTGVRNVSVIRTHVRPDEPRRVGFWMAARHSWAHYMKYSERGEPMPMAYAIGTHPAYEIAANYSGPLGEFDEYELGATLLGETVDMVKCTTIDLEVPAHAEVVIEGLVPPGIREPEGPFGEFTGYKGGKVGTSPVMEITAITRRAQPIFRHMQATVFTDHQPLVQLPMEAALFRRLQSVHGNSEIIDVHVPPWASLFMVIVQVTARWDGQARDVALAALTSANLHPKIVITVDEDVDIYSARDVLWALSTRVNPAVDVHVIPHERIHPLDQSVAPISDEVTVMRIGGKMIIDATKPATWRPNQRAEFERVQPTGFDDQSIRHLVQRVRQFADQRA
jgi:2,5-furandicarboxylate decarboxylase 1